MLGIKSQWVVYKVSTLPTLLTLQPLFILEGSGMKQKSLFSGTDWLLTTLSWNILQDLLTEDTLGRGKWLFFLMGVSDA